MIVVVIVVVRVEVLGLRVEVLELKVEMLGSRVEVRIGAVGRNVVPAVVPLMFTGNPVVPVELVVSPWFSAVTVSSVTEMFVNNNDDKKHLKIIIRFYILYSQ